MRIFRFCQSAKKSKLLLAGLLIGVLTGSIAGSCPADDTHSYVNRDGIVSHFPAPPPSRNSSPPEPPQPEPRPAVDPTKKALVNALHRRDQYRTAREIIRTRLETAKGRVETFWLTRLAENYRVDGQPLKAARTWGRLIETRSRGPLADWKLGQARSYRTAGRVNEAEVLLLRIRFEHPRSAPWLDAMLDLAQISLNRSRPREARRLLSIASRRFPPRNHPQLAYDLARIYDRYPSIRNISRAVQLYELAASRFPSQRDQARQARRRAAHLTRAYLEYGVE